MLAPPRLRLNGPMDAGASVPERAITVFLADDNVIVREAATDGRRRYRHQLAQERRPAELG